MKNQLREARRATNLSYRAAADAIGWSLTTLQRREAQDFDPGNLTEYELQALERVYRFPRAVILGHEPVPQPATEKEKVSA